MTQIHVVIRRISPALKIDLAQIGYLKDGQFENLPLDAIANSPAAHFLKNSNISDSLYVDHSEITNFISSCGSLPGFGVEFFDNTIVLMFDYNLSYNEGATKEEGKRD